MKNRLLNNTSYYFAISFLPSLIGLFTMPIYTRLLSTEGYGTLALVNVYIEMLSIVMSFQLYSAVGRLYFDFMQKNLIRYYSTLVNTILFVSVTLLLILIFKGSTLVNLLFQSNVEYFPAFLIGSIIACLQLPIAITTAFFRVEHQAKDLAIIIIIGLVIGTATGLYFVITLKLGIIGVVLSRLLASTFIFFAQFIYYIKFYSLIIDLLILKTNIRFALPIIPHALGGYLFMYSDKLILEKYVSISLVGVYAVADTIARVFKSFVNAFSTTFYPVFIEKCKISISEGKDLVYEVSRSWFVVLGVSFYFFSILTKPVIFILTTEEFYYAQNIIPVLAFAYLLRGVYIFPVNTFYFTKKTSFLSLVTIMSGIINIFLNILIIPNYGIDGAVLSTLFSFTLNLIAFQFLSKFTFIIKYDKSGVLFLISVVLSTFVIIYFFNFKNLYFELGIKLFLGVVIVFMSSKILDYNKLKKFKI
tara:strand:+ start:3479 stop:4900 length:1422 start_codon:yes stop_codon:yes gene_type:complete